MRSFNGWMKCTRVLRRVTSGAFRYSSANSCARPSALPFGTTSATTPHSCAVRAGSASGIVAHILEGRPLGSHNHVGEQRIIGVNMRASLDRRDDRHTYVGYVFQNLNAFVVNLAPDAGIGDIAPGRPFDARDKVATCTRQDYDLVRSILRNPVEGLDKLRVSLCGHNARATVGVELNNQNTVGVSCQLYVVIRSEVVSLMWLHRSLLSVWLGRH